MNIFISNLSYAITDQDLNDAFADYGQIRSAKVIKDRETGRSRGFGFVEIDDEAAAKKAIEELNQAEFDGKVINVSEARPREDKPRNNFRPRNNERGGFDNSRRRF